MTHEKMPDYMLVREFQMPLAPSGVKCFAATRTILFAFFNAWLAIPLIAKDR